jgi:hypothetical protein
MNRFISWALVCCAVLASGCTTIKCEGEKTGTGELTITVTKGPSGIGKAAKFLGQGFSAQGGLGFGFSPPGAPPSTPPVARDLTDKEKEAAMKEAEKAATKWIEENDKNICNKCEDGFPCAAKLHDIEFKLSNYPKIQQTSNGWEVTLVYQVRWKVGCGPCTECRGEVQGKSIGKSDSAISSDALASLGLIDPAALNADASGESCAGETQIVFGDQVMSVKDAEAQIAGY